VALSKFRDDPTIPTALRRILEQEQPGRISDVCLGALGAFDQKTAVDTLLEASQHEEYQTRTMAAVSLGDLAANTNAFVQADAALALANAGLTVVDELALLAQNAQPHDPAQPARPLPEEQYRWAKETVHGLGRTDSEIAVQMVGTVLSFSSGQDARLAEDCVATLGGFRTNDLAAAILAQSLADPNPNVRMVAARSLLLVSGAAAADIVRAASEKETNENVRRDIQRALRYSPGLGQQDVAHEEDSQ
jgi:HEAT repeat protein